MVAAQKPGFWEAENFDLDLTQALSSKSYERFGTFVGFYPRKGSFRR
jgi:hypothetical protein